MDDRKHTNRREVILQFIRFNIVGIMNTALGYAVYSGLVFIGVNHFLALVADYTVGTVFSFAVNKRLTFRMRGQASAGMLARMIVFSVSLFGVNTFLLWVLIDLWGMNKYLGQAFAAAALAFFSFTAQRLFVYRVHKREHHGTGQ